MGYSMVGLGKNPDHKPYIREIVISIVIESVVSSLHYDGKRYYPFPPFSLS